MDIFSSIHCLRLISVALCNGIIAEALYGSRVKNSGLLPQQIVPKFTMTSAGPHMMLTLVGTRKFII